MVNHRRFRISSVRCGAPALLLTLMTLIAVSGCRKPSDDSDTAPIVFYSAVDEPIVGNMMHRASSVFDGGSEGRFGGSAIMQELLLREAGDSEADIFVAPGASSIGTLSAAGLLTPLSQELLHLVPESLRAEDGTWIGFSGRIRTLAVNPALVAREAVPVGLDPLLTPEWRAAVGWVPDSPGFADFVHGLVQVRGRDGAEAWLRGMVENGTQAYTDDAALLQAIDAGDVKVGLTDHAQIYRHARFGAQSSDIRAMFIDVGGPGSLLSVAAVGVTAHSARADDAMQMIAFLLDEKSQEELFERSGEYPLVDGSRREPSLPPIEALLATQIDLRTMVDDDATEELLRSAGVIE